MEVGDPQLFKFLDSMTSEWLSKSHKSVMEWEAIVLAAVAIRIYSASFVTLPKAVRHVVGPVTKAMEFMMVLLPNGVMDVAAAETYLNSEFLTRANQPLFLLTHQSRRSSALTDSSSTMTGPRSLCATVSR
jgi:hypothetical protein